MSISVVSTMAVLLLVLFLFLSQLGDFGHVSSRDYCHTVDSGCHVITDSGSTRMRRSDESSHTGIAGQLSDTSQSLASLDVEHAFKSEAVQDKTTAEYNDTTERAASTLDEAKEAYEDAEKKVGEAYQTAEETWTECAREKYEDAKEKASKAAGDLGAKMREGKEEL